jgi:hypothetical protein
MANLRPLLLLVASVVVPVRSEAATTWVWPSFNCFGTLQECIDFAFPGDIVEVASQGPISENLKIKEKSLTVQPHPGFFPVFETGRVSVTGGNANVAVTIQGLTFKAGYLSFTHAGSGSFDARALDNTFLDSANYRAIRIDSLGALHGPLTFAIEGNRIAVNEATYPGYGSISVGPFHNTARGKIVGNVIQQTGAPTQGSVVDVSNSDSPLAVDILGNEIRGTHFNAGISLYQFGTRGRLSARLVNNLVVGQSGFAGAPAGIALNSTHGTLTAQVINNTIAGGELGVTAGARVDLGARLTGILANNLVVGHRRYGIYLSPEVEGTFLNENNLSFRNLVDVFTPGPGTLFDDPLFQTANDFRLRSTSPAKDAGTNAQVPPDVSLDLGGSPRIQGAAVAIGAYER